MENCGRRTPNTDEEGHLLVRNTPTDEQGKPLAGRWIGSRFYTPAPPPTPEMEAGPYVAPLPPTARRMGEPLACGCTVWEPNEICRHWRENPRAEPAETWQERVARGIPAFSSYRVYNP